MLSVNVFFICVRPIKSPIESFWSPFSLSHIEEIADEFEIEQIFMQVI